MRFFARRCDFSLDARVEPVQKPEYFGKLLDFSQIFPSSGLFYLNVAEKASFFAFFWVFFWFWARESRLCFRPCGTLARAYVRAYVRRRVRERIRARRGVERAMGLAGRKKVSDKFAQRVASATCTC